MNLIEAKNILLNNGYYITEFVNTTIPIDKLCKFINNKYKFKIIDIENESDTSGLYYLYIDEVHFFKEACQNFKNFIEKYGYQFRCQYGDKLEIQVTYNNKEQQQCNYYTHASYANPDIILKTGLRCKANNTDEKRIYLQEDKYNTPVKNIKDKLYFITKLNDAGFKQFDNYVCHYIYQIELPSNYPIYIDPEFKDDVGKRAVYIINNIPAKYITLIDIECDILDKSILKNRLLNIMYHKLF